MATPVFREYDQQALDAEYKQSREGQGQRRLALALRDRQPPRRARRFRARLDLAYGSHPGEHLDVFPARGGPAPVHVFIHGGYWHRLDKSDSSFVARAFHRRVPRSS
jgi:arylformamidase